MKINKNQALYRALPSCWTTYSDSDKSDYKYACQVIAWNTIKVSGINEEMIKNDIERRVISFSRAGGIVNDEFSYSNINNFEFVEPAMNEGIPDIRCSINPKTFYCQKCGEVLYQNQAVAVPFCPTCKNSKMNQLQMVYACECGYAEGVKPNTSEKLFYHSKDKDNQFKFFTIKGIKREMEMKCPVCGKRLYPKNATDSRLFYSQSGNIVNLYNEEYSKLLKRYKFDAELLMLAKWFGTLTNEQFTSILENSKNFFEYKAKDVNDPDVLLFSKSLGKSPEEIVAMLSANEANVFSISKVKKDINNILPFEHFGSTEKLITSNLLEFDTLKYPKSKITLNQAIKKGKEIDSIIDEDDIYELIEKLHINEIQISEAVQIVNYAYGYTRLRSCPDGTDSTINLRLRGFGNKVFTTILETEGILVEMDMLKIFEWLQNNNFVSKDIEINSVIEAKRWFLENIKLDSITHFSPISGETNRVTKIVYSLLHTISHMMIISCGKHSGLSRDSISELIFPETCSFFIYPTSSEGIILGSVSGMFETKLNNFLEDTLKENEICTFDPVCSNHQNGACVACSYLSEVNCTHFNKDLSRSYLYGGTIKTDGEDIVIKKGFWK